MSAVGLDLSQHVINAVVAHVLRWGRPPRAVLAVTDEELRGHLGEELRARGLEVLEAEHARTLHTAVRCALTWPKTESIDLFVLDAELEGCSPLHAIAFARSRNLASPAILLTDESDPLSGADVAGLDLCSRTHACEAIDRSLLRALRRRWSERPAAA
ncbi:MAG: hypothetical protein HYV09_40485 [Deltaproteobacteria bacterium]|nr:hypothetical protein [Deltaproteobacteria bacterium]